MRSFRQFLKEEQARNHNLQSIIARTDMPQFDDKLLAAMKEYFGYTEAEMTAAEMTSLRTVQKHVDWDKVEKMYDENITGGVVLSDDGYIVDGNHRALAFMRKKNSDPTAKCSVIILGGGIVDILAKSKEMADS